MTGINTIVDQGKATMTEELGLAAIVTRRAVLRQRLKTHPDGVPDPRLDPRWLAIIGNLVAATIGEIDRRAAVEIFRVGLSPVSRRGLA